MTKTIVRSWAVALLAAVVTTLSGQALAAPKVASTHSAATRKAPVKHRRAKLHSRRSFEGKLTAIDRIHLILTVQTKKTKEVFAITPQTRFWKRGQPALYEDGVLGGTITGSARRDKGGHWELVSVRYGPKTIRTASHKKHVSRSARHVASVRH